jgi:hypothetical protein
MTPSAEQDFDRLRRLLSALGYVKTDAGLPPQLGTEFFDFSASQRFNVALFSEKNGTFRLKLVEHGEKHLSPIGQQQVSLITSKLETEFGHERVILNFEAQPKENLQ